MDPLDTLNLLKSCLLPELKQDLDCIPIERQHFKAYHENLQIKLPFLYDWMQQNPNDFHFDKETEGIRHEVQACLIVLLCEISYPESIFKLDKPELIKNAERILDTYGSLPKEVEKLICKYYEDQLHKDKWKKHIGAVHGFVKYLQYRFDDTHTRDRVMSQQFLTFCLSVALHIRSCYETHYKILSTSIFLVMLQHGANDDIISMNIHSVVYDAAFKDSHIMDSISFITKEWNCLMKCLDFYKNFDSFTIFYNLNS